jgi:hypothetical protein
LSESSTSSGSTIQVYIGQFSVMSETGEDEKRQRQISPNGIVGAQAILSRQLAEYQVRAGARSTD